MQQLRNLFVSLLGLSLGAGLSTAVQAADCEPLVTKMQTFAAGSGALRNTSTDGAESDGSSKSKTITAVVQLVCEEAESRIVRVDLASANNVGGAPAIILESAAAKLMAAGDTARFRFTVSYNKQSCQGGEGPVPKDQGGTNQINLDAFTFTGLAFFRDAPAKDPGPNQDSLDANADLICKPSRTTL